LTHFYIANSSFPPPPAPVHGRFFNLRNRFLPPDYTPGFTRFSLPLSSLSLVGRETTTIKHQHSHVAFTLPCFWSILFICDTLEAICLHVLNDILAIVLINFILCPFDNDPLLILSHMVRFLFIYFFFSLNTYSWFFPYYYYIIQLDLLHILSTFSLDKLTLRIWFLRSKISHSQLLINIM